MARVDVKKRIAPPLGLACLAAVLEREFEVEILDTVIEGFDNETAVNEEQMDVGLSWEEIAKRIAEFKPDLVGISCAGTDQAPNAHRVCSLIKEINPNIYTVMGGIYPTTQPMKAMEDKNLDSVILGEGEESFSQLIQVIMEGGNDPFKEIDGLTYRANGRVALNPKTHFISDIDSLPMPARHKLRMDLYLNAKLSYRFGPLRHPHTSIFTSRGCPGRCIFCDAHLVMGRKYRPRSAEKTLDEIESLIEDYGIKELAFLDDNLTWDKKRAIKIFDGMIERKFDLIWMTPNGVAIYALDEELLEKMRKSGCYQIYLAIESGVQRVLRDIIHKPLKLDGTNLIAKKCKELGMETIGMFVIGFPGETIEEIERTAEYAQELDLDYVSFSIATPYPGTEMFNICKKKRYFISDFSEEDSFIYGFGKGLIKTPEFTPEEVLRVRKKAWQRINFENPQKKEKVEEFLNR